MSKGSGHQAVQGGTMSRLGRSLPGLTRTRLLSGHQLVVALLVLKANSVIAFSCSWEIE